MEQPSIFQEKNLPKAVRTLAIPAMLGQLTTLIYNIADTYFVAMTNDPNQIAAVTLCAPVLLILMSLGVIFGNGGSSFIARLLGEKKEKQAVQISCYCFYSCIITGVVVFLIGLFMVNPIAQLLGSDADSLSFTKDYLRYIFFGTPFLVLGNAMLHIFRSVGIIKPATIGLVLGNAANIVLDFVFIVLLRMGTAGAALATSLGFVVNCVYYIIYLQVKKSSLISLSLRNYHPDWKTTVQVFSIGIPGALITILMSLANIVLNNYIAMYGSTPVASYGIASKLNMIPIMLSVGLAQGVAPLIGFCYGAKEFDRLRKTMSLSSIYGIILGAVFLTLFYLTGNMVTGFFFQKSELVQQSALFLHILCVSVPVISIINIVTTFYQAIGKAIPSLFLTICRNALCFIPILIGLNHFFGLNGVISAQPATEFLLAAICLIMYRISIRKLINE